MADENALDYSDGIGTAAADVAGRNGDPQKSTPRKPTFNSGYEKAAILIIALGEEVGAKLLKDMDRQEMERVTRAISRLERVSPEQVDYVLNEYYTLVQHRKYQLAGGYDKAKEFLINARGPAEAMLFLERYNLQLAEDGFSIIRRTDVTKLSSYIRKENHQVGALIVANLENEHAANVLGMLPDDMAISIAIRISEMGTVDPEVVDEIANDMISILGEDKVTFDEFEKGPSAVANILNAADTVTESSILEGIEKIDPDLAEEIRNQMFFFEDFILVDDRTMQIIINACPRNELTMALKGARPELMQKFTGNMSTRAKDMLVEDMEMLGPLTLNQVRESQQQIVKAMKKLVDDGKIVVVKDKTKLVE